MGLFDKIKKAFSGIDNSTESQKKIVVNNTDEQQYKYPILFQKYFELYSALSRYEYCLCGIDGISFYREMYEKTRDEMFLESLNENKCKIFVKPAVIKDLIYCAKEIYHLNKNEFLSVSKEFFDKIAVNEEYSSEFCYNYLSKELMHYVY